MALRDPREIEREIDTKRADMKNILADESRPAEDRRDMVNQVIGEIGALEVQARELREYELEQARLVGANGSEVGSAGAAAEASEAFANLVRFGDPKSAALHTSPDSEGGYLMPPAERQEIIDVVRKYNPILADATVINLADPGTYEVDLPRKTGKTAGGWVGEEDARTATSAPTYAMPTLRTEEWYAYPEATQKFLSGVSGAEQFIIQDITDTFAEVLGTGLAAGTGAANKQPEGLFTSGSSFYSQNLSSTANALDAPQFLKAYFDLPGKYLSKAKWYMKGATAAVLATLPWPNLGDTPLVENRNGVFYILGKPIEISDDAPAIGAGAFPVAFGDVSRGYAVGIHGNISILRDPFTNKGKIGFYTSGHAGGRPWDPAAIRLLKSGNA